MEETLPNGIDEAYISVCTICISQILGFHDALIAMALCHRIGSGALRQQCRILKNLRTDNFLSKVLKDMGKKKEFLDQLKKLILFGMYGTLLNLPEGFGMKPI